MIPLEELGEILHVHDAAVESHGTDLDVGGGEEVGCVLHASRADEIRQGLALFFCERRWRGSSGTDPGPWPGCRGGDIRQEVGEVLFPKMMDAVDGKIPFGASADLLKPIRPDILGDRRDLIPLGGEGIHPFLCGNLFQGMVCIGGDEIGLLGELFAGVVECHGIEFLKLHFAYFSKYFL